MEWIIIKLLIVLLIVGVAAIIALTVDKIRLSSIRKMSFRETMDLCELPIVTFYNNGKKLNFLLDTGANQSIINSRDLEGLSYTRNNKKGDVYGMEGNRIDVSFIDMSIEYKGKFYEDEFQVIDMSAPFNNLKEDYGINLHGILSSVFFQKYKYTLDFNELIAYSKT